MATFIDLGAGRTKAIIRLKELGPGARTKSGLDKEVRKWAADVEAELKGTGTSTYHAMKDAQIGGVLEAFRDEEVLNRKGARHDTHRINKFLREPWKHLDFTQDIATALNEWKKKSLAPKPLGYGLAPGSVRRDLNLIHSAVEWARKEKGLKLPFNPVSQIKRPKDSGRRTRVWFPEDLKVFIEATGYDLDTKPETQTAKVGWVLMLARYTGWRLSEICKVPNQTRRQANARTGSRRGYIDLAVPEVFFPETEMDGDKKVGGTKNDAGFHAPLRAEAVVVIEALLKHFPAPAKMDLDAPPPSLLGIDEATAGELFRRLRARVAVDHPELSNIVIHELRHTFTSEMAVALEGDVPALLAVTGRKSVTSLVHYTHHQPGTMAKRMNAGLEKMV